MSKWYNTQKIADENIMSKEKTNQEESGAGFKLFIVLALLAALGAWLVWRVGSFELNRLCAAQTASQSQSTETNGK